MAGKTWFVYLLECCDGSLYTGITTDLNARMNAHASGKGSKYVLSHGFKQLIGSKVCLDRSSASQCEYAIKHLSPEAKRAWFNPL